MEKRLRALENSGKAAFCRAVSNPVYRFLLCPVFTRAESPSKMSRLAFHLVFFPGDDKIKVIEQDGTGKPCRHKMKKRASLDALFFDYFIEMGVHPVGVVVRERQDVILIHRLHDGSISCPAPSSHVGHVEIGDG